jgi:GH24 family phage-related lysozyme (muramidase)
MATWFDDKDDIKTYVQGSRSGNRPHEMMEMRNTKTVPNTVQAETSATNKSKINPSVNNTSWSTSSFPGLYGEDKKSISNNKNTKQNSKSVHDTTWSTMANPGQETNKGNYNRTVEDVDAKSTVVKNNQTTVEEYISSGENDAKFKSYAAINYANSGIQTVAQKVNAILASNPKWTKMDALNYLDGKWVKLGYSDNTPRWNNGRIKDLEVSDEISKIKGGQDYNTWGGGLRSRFEGNWGTLTDKETYTQNLNVRANSQYLEPGSAAWNRNKALGEASKALSGGKSTNPLEALFSVIMSAVGVPLTLLTGQQSAKSEAISKQEQGMLESSVITKDIMNLMDEYNLTKQNVEDSMDAGSPNPTELGRMMDLENSLKNAVGGDLPAVLRSMSMDGDNIIFNEPMNQGELKNMKTRLRLIEDEKSKDEEPYRVAHGDMNVNNTASDVQPQIADNTTIDLADPYIGVAWWRDRGGFEKMFGIPLPYKKNTQTITLKEGGIVGYQTGGTIRPPSMINDPNALPAQLRADDVDLQAEEGDFIMGYPAMQQNGPRVRSLVEQAMLKAKDSGVKTKGYKHGDKIDILVHNGEMHIPNELVNYIDGGYTTLKNLNKPSKHREGETVQEKTEGFMQKPQDTAVLDEMQSDLESDTPTKVPEDLPTEQIILTDEEKAEKRRNNVFYDNGFDALEDTKWTILKNKFKELLPKDLNNYEQNAYTNVALDDLYNSLIDADQENNRDIFNKINSSQFLKNLHLTSKNNMLLSNIHRVFGKKLKYRAYLNDRNIAYQYDGSNLFAAPVNEQKKYKEDTTLIDFWKSEENPGYKEQGFYTDESGKLHIGYGHQIINDEEESMFKKIINENDGIFPQELALELLKKDKINFTNQARKVFNSFAKYNSTKKYGSNQMKITNFDDLQPAVKDMLIELAFNLGASETKQFGKGSTGLAEYDDFMIAASQNNYENMAKQYKRFIIDKKTNEKKELTKRNTNFYNTWLSSMVDN